METYGILNHHPLRLCTNLRPRGMHNFYLVYANKQALEVYKVRRTLYDTMIKSSNGIYVISTEGWSSSYYNHKILKVKRVL